MSCHFPTLVSLIRNSGEVEVDTQYSRRIIACTRVSVCTRRAYPLRLYLTFCSFTSFFLFLSFPPPPIYLSYLSLSVCLASVSLQFRLPVSVLRSSVSRTRVRTRRRNAGKLPRFGKARNKTRGHAVNSKTIGMSVSTLMAPRSRI